MKLETTNNMASKPNLNMIDTPEANYFMKQKTQIGSKNEDYAMANLNSRNVFPDSSIQEGELLRPVLPLAEQHSNVDYQEILQTTNNN